MGYTRITAEERERIALGLAMNKSQQEIADELGRDKSTISREIRRNRLPDGSYSAFKAQDRATQMAGSRNAGGKLERNSYLCRLVEHALSCYWSPEQISKWLRSRFPALSAMHVSHETIYTYLYVQGKGTLKQELTRYLRRERTKRKPRTGRAETRGKIPDMISIHERPPEVEERTVPGHWEGDLIMGAGNKMALGALAERTSRYLLLVRMEGHDAGTTREAFAQVMCHLPEHLRRTLTYDNVVVLTLHSVSRIFSLYITPLLSKTLAIV